MNRSAACPICRAPSAQFLPFRGINGSNQIEKDVFQKLWIYRCGSCDHSFADKTQINGKAIERYYENEYWDNRLRIGDLLRDLRIYFRSMNDERANTQVSLVRQYLKRQPARVLEIGAGSAGFSRRLGNAAKLRGELHVAEPSRRFNCLYRLSGIQRIARTFEDVPEDPSGYSLIVASHWLEHTTDLLGTIHKIWKLAGEKGIVLVEVPSCDADYWAVRHFPDPPHFQFFTAVGLHRIFESAGFKTLFVGTCGPKTKDDVGYLPKDCPEIMTEEELVVLHNQRDKRFKEWKGRNELAQFSLGTYSPNGRAYLRLVVEKP